MFHQSQIKKILINHNIKPSKRLGQNFLIDKNINDKILKYINATKDDIIIEIGAGFGNLTIPLAQRAYRVYAIEKDKRIAEVLKENLSNFDNAYVIIDDFLKVELREILKNKSLKNIKMAGNLPYCISSPVMFRLMDYRNKISSAIFIFQKEVAERLIAAPHSKNYGILRCLINLYAETHKIMNISKNSFYPKPQVDSSLIKLGFLPKPRFKIDNNDVFVKVVKAAFSKRRKYILNALSTYYNLKLDKKLTSSLLDKLDIDYKTRAEDICPENYAKLSNLVNKKISAG